MSTCRRCGRALVHTIEGDNERFRCPLVASHWWTYMVRGNHTQLLGPIGFAVMLVEWR